MDLSVSAARGALATLGGQGLRFLVQAASVTVLARLLTPQDYGLFAEVLAVVGVAAVLGDFGLSMAAIQARDISHQQRSNLFWSNLALGAVLTAAVMLASHPLADFYGHQQIVDITLAVAPVFFINSCAAQFRAETSARLRFKWLAGADVAAQVVGFAVALVFALRGSGYWALVAQQVTASLVSLPVLVLGSRWWPSWPRRGERMRALYSFGANTFGVQLLVFVTSNIDNLLIGKIAGSRVLGLYSRAYQLFRLPLQQVAAPLTDVAMPILSRIQDDGPRFEAYVRRSQLVLAYCFGGLFLVLASVNDPLIDILLGSQWGSVKPLFVILAVGGAFQGMGYVYYWVFLAKALTHLQLRTTVYGRSLMVVAMVVGAHWGATGVALGSSLGQAVIWAINAFVIVPRVGLHTGSLVRVALRPLMLFGVMAAITLTVSAELPQMNAWLKMLLLVVTMTVVLAACALVAAPVRRDLADLVDTVRRVRRPRSPDAVSA